MTLQNTNMNASAQIQLLIDYKFNFQDLINVYDNIKHQNGLILLLTRTNCYPEIELLIDHCKSLSEYSHVMKHRDTRGKNSLFYAAKNDSRALSHILSIFSFSDASRVLKNEDNRGHTVPHDVANNPRPNNIDTLKLLKMYSVKFNTKNKFGQLPIHIACIRNNHSVLSWMIDQRIVDKDIINIQTKNMQTPLWIAVSFNCFECVDVLCKQASVVIRNEDITCALENDNVRILKLLICGVFRQRGVKNWNDIEKSRQPKRRVNVNGNTDWLRSVFQDSDISSDVIQAMIGYCAQKKKSQCYWFLTDLYNNGYSIKDYKSIVFKLDYNIKTAVNRTDSIVSIDTEHRINRKGSLSTKMKRMIGNSRNTNKKDEIEYAILRVLGRGSFGVVELGEHKKTNKKVAIKHINLKKENHQSMPIQFITSEIESLKQMNNHPNIIKLVNYKLNVLENNVALYFEYCEKGELYQLLNQCDYFSLRISFAYFLQLLSAINQCHKKNIVHRDLKLQNILVTTTFQLKIADFGLASIMNKDNEKNETMYNVGT